jgi:hypothetical protein
MNLRKIVRETIRESTDSLSKEEVQFLIKKVREIDNSRKGDNMEWEADDFVEQLLNFKNNLTKEEVKRLHDLEKRVGEEELIRIVKEEGTKAIEKHGTCYE